MSDMYQQIEDLINEFKIVEVVYSSNGKPLRQRERPIVEPETAHLLADLLVNNGVIIQKKVKEEYVYDD